MTTCPHCGGTLSAGLTKGAMDDPVAAELAVIRLEISVREIEISFDGYVAEKDAGRLVALEAKTLCNRRGTDEPIPYRKFGKKVQYHIEDLARFRAARIKKKGDQSSRNCP
jgi:hypothetical protein